MTRRVTRLVQCSGRGPVVGELGTILPFTPAVAPPMMKTTWGTLVLAMEYPSKNPMVPTRMKKTTKS